MQTSTAYLAGAATIVAALGIGLGGGFIAANIMNPATPKQGAETSKLERRVSPAAPAATDAPKPVERADASKPRPATAVPNVRLGASLAAASAQTSQHASGQAAQPSQGEQPSQAAQPSSDKPREAAPQTAKADPNSGSDAQAKASDEDVKRATEADARKRTAERHRRWVKHRRYQARREQEPREANDTRDAGSRSRSRDADTRGNAAEPRFEFPQVRLFGSDPDD